MKSLMIKFIACAALFLPFSQVQAAGAGKTFGGLKPKQTFSLKVTKVESLKKTGTGDSQVPIPAGFPQLKVGQTVKFTIGAKGQLTCPFFSLPFRAANPEEKSNSYGNGNVTPSKVTKIGEVVIDKKGNPVIAHITFYNFIRVDIPPFVYGNQVTYSLKK